MTNTTFANERIKLGLLVGVSLVSLFLGFVYVSPATALTLVRYSGYWFVTLMLVGIIWFGLQSWREAADTRERRSVDWPGFLVVAVAWVLMVAQMTWGLRVVMDEVLLLGTSQYMHFSREALAPLHADIQNGAFHLLGGYLDKRPLLFQTLLSYLHDISGYRIANSFVLNGALGICLLGLVHLIGRQLGGRKVGMLGVLIFSSLPLLAQVITGGGFEVLNLVVICAVILCGSAAVGNPSPARLTFFVYAGLLLSQVRYETVLFIVPVALVVAWIWWKERRIILTWPMIFAPLFVLPYVWQNKAFEVHAEFWQPKDHAAPDIPFSIDHLVSNAGHAVNFLFSWDGSQGSSLLVTIPGIIAFLVALVLIALRIRRLREMEPVRQVFVIFLPFFVANLLVILAHSWGQFDQYITRRLSLPFLLFLVLCVMFVIAEAARRNRVWTSAYAVAGLFLLVYTVPTNRRGEAAAGYAPARDVMWTIDFVSSQPDRNFLVIDESPVTWLVQEVPAIGLDAVAIGRPALEMWMKNRTYRAIYVAQHVFKDAATGEAIVVADDRLDPGIVLEEVAGVSFTASREYRISRVVDILPLDRLPVRTAEDTNSTNSRK